MSISDKQKAVMQAEESVCAPTYHPLPVVLEKGQGVWLWDQDGRRYLDMMSAYSAVSHGHCHPELVATLSEQAQRLALTSRAFYVPAIASLLEKLCALSGFEMGILMNTGAEGVETAIKSARRWGYRHKKIPPDQADIIVASGNFHGRTTTIISFSSEPSYRSDFGPLTPGFTEIPYGDIEALEKAITPDTCAFLVEPIQGEAGIVVPPQGWLAKAHDLCRRHNVLLILDEVQTGLCRTGHFFAYQEAGIQPDGLILGKALGGGLIPISAFLSHQEVLQYMTPGSHGSTFGGNPLACAVAEKALEILQRDNLAERTQDLGQKAMSFLRSLKRPCIREVRGRGLLMGIELDPKIVRARTVCLDLLERGLLSKETHETVLRLAPPLIITEEELMEGLALVKDVLSHY